VNQRGGSLGDPYFELISRSRYLAHQHRKDQKDEVINNTRCDIDLRCEEKRADKR